MRRFDCFPFRDEFDMLECRLTELEDVVDVFVLVEADVTHGHNQPKPYHYQENQDRFTRWADRIVAVQATGLPSAIDPWTREHAQREWIRDGLEQAGAEPDDIIFQSDVDEIPRTEFVEFVNPTGFVVAQQDFRSFKIGWRVPDSHPEQPWQGTIAARYSFVQSFAKMRSARTMAPVRIPDSGWHLTWFGDNDDHLRKITSFCHPEIEPRVRPRLEEFAEQGRHVDLSVLEPADTTDVPRWIAEGKAPASWT